MFKYLKNSFVLNKWDPQEDELLKQCIRYINLRLFFNYLCDLSRKVDESLWFDPSRQSKISWTAVSKEFNKEIQQMIYFKTEKKCKERWFNHLCPFLTKYELYFYLYLYLFFIGKNGLLKKIFFFYQNRLKNQNNGQW